MIVSSFPDLIDIGYRVTHMKFVVVYGRAVNYITVEKGLYCREEIIFVYASP